MAREEKHSEQRLLNTTTRVMLARRENGSLQVTLPWAADTNTRLARGAYSDPLERVPSLAKTNACKAAWGYAAESSGVPGRAAPPVLRNRPPDGNQIQDSGNGHAQEPD
jgi:hypothetical protein